MTLNSASGCVVIRGSDRESGERSNGEGHAISAASVGSQSLCMMLTTIPPGAKAPAHLHPNHETAIYILSGAAEVCYGAALDQCVVASEGDFLYIPAGLPHRPANLSQTEPCVGVLARTDPNVQENVILWPDDGATVPSTFSLNGN